MKRTNKLVRAVRLFLAETAKEYGTPARMALLRALVEYDKEGKHGKKR